MARAALLLLAIASLRAGGAVQGVGAGATPESSATVGSRIFGGWTTPQGIYYQAALRRLWSQTITCGGALIRPQWVLSAGHCVWREAVMEVTMGATYYDGRRERSRITEFTDCIKLHPEYRPSGEFIKANDIALLHLPAAMPTSDSIDIIALPTLAEAQSRSGYWGTISGWGSTEDSNGESSPVLKQGNILTLGMEFCKKVFPASWITDKQLCMAGYSAGYVDAVCHGDSGGPFVVNNKVYGVASFGSQVCDEGNPSVFTHVGSYLQWINGHINTQSPCPNAKQNPQGPGNNPWGNKQNPQGPGNNPWGNNQSPQGPGNKPWGSNQNPQGPGNKPWG